MTPPRYVVEAVLGDFFGQPVWFDLTRWVELQEGLPISRGRPDEFADPTPGRLQLVLDNSDGRFTPGLTTSPYYPYVTDGARVRVACIRPSTVNLIDNYSVEFGTAEWLPGGTVAPTVAPSSTRAHSGGWSLLVTWGTGGVLPSAGRTMYGLDIGQQYTASAYIWSPTGDPNVTLVIAGGGGGTASSVHDAWDRISVTFVATETSHTLQVWPATAPTAGDQVWVDSLQLEEGAAATTLAVGAEKLDRYYGFTSELPVRWLGSGLYAQVSWSALDWMERISSRAGSLRPMDVEEPLLDQPVTFLPLDDPDTATQAGNLGSGQGSAAVVNVGGGGAYAFASGTGPPADGTSSLVLTPASATSGYYLVAATFLLQVTAPAVLTVEAWINTATSGRTILDLSSTAVGSTGFGPTLSIQAGTGKLLWTSDLGALTALSPASVATGATTHVAAVYEQDGTDHSVTLYVNGSGVGTTSVAATGTAIGATYLLVGGGKKLPLFSGTINHVAVYPTALAADRIAAHYHAGWDGFAGERSDRRISRLAAYAGMQSLTPANLTGIWVLGDTALGVLGSTTILASSDLDLEVGSAVVHGQSTGGADYLTEMRNVTLTEGGLVLADLSGRLQFHNRSHRYNTAALVTVPAEYATAGLFPDYSTQYVVNDVAASTQDGAVIRVKDDVSILQRGTYDRPLRLLTRDALDAYSAAGWLVGRNAQPRGRYRQVTFDLLTLPADTVTALLHLDIGDRFDLTDLPTQTTSTAGLMVEGYTETATADSWTLTFETSPAEGYQVWQLGIPSLSTLGTSTVLAW